MDCYHTLIQACLTFETMSGRPPSRLLLGREAWAELLAHEDQAGRHSREQILGLPVTRCPAAKPDAVYVLPDDWDCQAPLLDDPDCVRCFRNAGVQGSS